MLFREEAQSWLARIMGLKGFRKRIPGLIGPGGRRSDVCGEKEELCRAEPATVWEANKAAAERWYDRTSRCEFTAFHGWEYSHSPKSTKVHRNIILRNDTDSGCEAIAIPHNPNLSNGLRCPVEYAELPAQRQREDKRVGVNLYAFGFVGSTDTHMSTPGALQPKLARFRRVCPVRSLYRAATRRAIAACSAHGGNGNRAGTD